MEDGDTLVIWYDPWSSSKNMKGDSFGINGRNGIYLCSYWIFYDSIRYNKLWTMIPEYYIFLSLIPVPC